MDLAPFSSHIEAQSGQSSLSESVFRINGEWWHPQMNQQKWRWRRHPNLWLQATAIRESEKVLQYKYYKLNILTVGMFSWELNKMCQPILSVKVSSEI